MYTLPGPPDRDGAVALLVRDLSPDSYAVQLSNRWAPPFVRNFNVIDIDDHPSGTIAPIPRPAGFR